MLVCSPSQSSLEFLLNSYLMRALGLLSTQNNSFRLWVPRVSGDLGACQRHQTQHGGRGCEKSSCRRMDQAMEKGFTWEVKGVLHKEQLMERKARKEETLRLGCV